MQQYEDSPRRRRGKNIKVLIIIVAVVAVLGLFFAGRALLWGRSLEEAELLSVVNNLNPLDKDYKPRLTKVDDVQVDRRCAEELGAMLSDCEAAGYNPLLTQGYISREEQQKRYDERVAWYTARTGDGEAARGYALWDVFWPGTDEHELGLAVDIVDGEYRTADVKQAETGTNRWLQENCWKYGFVLRYGDGKTDATGQKYSPWHFRYVGADAAAQMFQLELSLEEYLAWFYSEEAIVIYS